MPRTFRPLAVVFATTIALSLSAPALAEQPGEYRNNDAGGFRNVLPAGQTGVASAADFTAYLTNGTLPRHWADQQPLYENLLYGAADLTNRTIKRYYKSAHFGVRKRDVESRIRPRRGVTIIRDRQYGVPHIYGATRADTMFGAGYAGAADRLFLMDVLRHTGRADLSSFLGGGNLGSDESQWRFAPYTDADLRQQITQARKRFGKLGRRMSRDLSAYVEGINAYIRTARQDADLMPVEYSLIGQPLRNWKRTDVIATASLIGGIFGRGGGSEVQGALVYRALEDRFGRNQARRIWLGFRDKNDPTAPVTVKQRFPYQTGDSFAKRGLAIPKAGSVTDAQVVATDSAPAPGAAGEMSGFGDQIRQSLQGAQMSNWLLVPARNSRNGQPLAVMGPQVGYYVPQVLTEMDLHGPGIDARGVSFAGVNLIVQMGRGRDYAWSATSAGSDNTDTFAEVLCGGDRYHYRYRGKCRPMEKLVRKVEWQPNVIDDTPAGNATLTVYRTVHGIVQSYGKVKGKRVAFALSRTTYFHEAESVIGFSRFNNPNSMTGVAQFKKAANSINFTFNWAYTDADHVAYFLSGAYPKRAPGTSPDLPVLGTGRYDWQGFDPKRFTMDVLPPSAHPQVVDPNRLISWNNKPATDWAAADDQWGYGPIYRSQMLTRQVDRHLRGDRKMTLAELVQSMAKPATQDIRGVKLLQTVRKVVGNPKDPQLRTALRSLDRWRKAGSHRRDLNRDGTYEHNAAIQIMDAWWPELVAAQFAPALGADAYESIGNMISLPVIVGPDNNPRAPGFSDGWWGYVQQDLQALLKGKRVDGGFPRVFCGNGDLSDCRTALRGALRRALAMTPPELYGYGACEDDPQASCWDKNRLRVTSAISVPKPFPFQNRPTFQQVVSIPQALSRIPTAKGNG